MVLVCLIFSVLSTIEQYADFATGTLFWMVSNMVKQTFWNVMLIRRSKMEAVKLLSSLSVASIFCWTFFENQENAYVIMQLVIKIVTNIHCLCATLRTAVP